MLMYPHALSNHPTKQKMAALHAYVFHALNICYADSLSKELNYLKFVAINRDFNPSYIVKAVKKKI